MEVTQLNFSSALQASAGNAKDEAPDQARQSVPVKIKDVAHLQNLLAKKSETVQKSHESENGTDATGNREGMLELARTVEEKLRSSRLKIQIEVNEEMNTVFIVIKEPVTDEVVRKVPPEELVKIYDSFQRLQGNKQEANGELDVVL